jgi:predicted metal-dependent peptidase
MSEVVAPTKKRKRRNEKLDKLIGPMDPKLDTQARDKLVGARVGLLLKHGFFGNLATNLKLVNADEWCATAATDGRRFYYNSRFINMLSRGELEFLFGHEVLHLVYDHLGRRHDRDPQIWNIADDYAVNADLKRHKVGEFITTVPCLYEHKYDGKPAEEIYDDLMQNVTKINIDDLIDRMIDDHMDQDGEGEGGGEGEGSSDGKGKGRPKPMTAEERDQLRQELKQQILAAAKAAEAGTVPAGVQRMIKDLTEPKMNWKELIQTNLTSAIRTDYSFMRPNRRGWHMEAIMPGMTPGEEIDICVAIDMSGSIGNEQAAAFLAEIRSIMESFTGYKIHVFCFDTEIYNAQDFTSDNLDTIDGYEPQGGGGTDFDCIFNYLKERGQDTQRLVVFTDGYPFNSWGDPNVVDTTWIIHGHPDPKPPFGTWALYDRQK